MTLSDETTWPQQVKDFLETQAQPLLNRELMMIDQPNSYNPYAFDFAHNEFTKILVNYHLDHAFHCTRLTEEEIAEIKQYGMQLPNLEILTQRIKHLVGAGVITTAIADKLIANNQADERYRKNMLHFVFQSPHFEGHGGIGRFFASWGGEALYNSHEGNPETGPILRQIGIPCIIEAKIPIANLSRNYLVDKFVRIYHINRGLKTEEPNHHEDHTKEPIPASDIVAIHRFPEPTFIELSGCKNWRPDQQLSFSPN
jgi:hypothetical protein